MNNLLPEEKLACSKLTKEQIELIYSGQSAMIFVSIWHYIGIVEINKEIFDKYNEEKQIKI